MKHNKIRKKSKENAIIYINFVSKRLLLLPLAHLAKYNWDICYFFLAKGCARPFIKFKSQICIKINCCFSFLFFKVLLCTVLLSLACITTAVAI